MIRATYNTLNLEERLGAIGQVLEEEGPLPIQKLADITGIPLGTIVGYRRRKLIISQNVKVVRS